jgi:hypothetical protein
VLGTAYLNGGGASSGTATWSGSFPTTGSHSLVAEYDVGDGTTSNGTLTQSVQTGAGASSVAVTSSANPVYSGVATTLTATVTGSSPKGYVTFKEGAIVLGTGALSSGIATLSTSFAAPPPSSHSITAVYAGDNVNAPSTSPVFTQSVSAPTLTVTSSANPAYPGQSFNVSVTVTAGVGGGNSPSGTLTLSDGNTTLGTTTISGGGAQTAVANFRCPFRVRARER